MKDTSPLTKLEVDCTHDGARNCSYYSDPVCGDYATGVGGVGNLIERDRFKLGKVLATRKLRGVSARLFLTESRSGETGAWKYASIAELLSQYPKDVVSILDEALINLSLMIQFPSEKIEITEITRWNIFAHDHDSEAYILRQLLDLGYIKTAGARSGGTYMIQSLTIESIGWKRLGEIREDSSISDQAFVAMWFDDQMTDYFDMGIMPAVANCGFRCQRIDLKEHNNKICDEIIAEIRRSRFLIADFSGNRGGVYYEAGFAHGLGIPVIWTVRQDFLEDVHFDTRQYNHIVYETPEDLRKRLTARINSTI